MPTFIDTQPSLDSYWRALILFGPNSASYKFALAKSLLRFAEEGRTFVSLEDLADPFASAIVEHLKDFERQGTAATSQFLSACRDFNAGKLSQEQLREKTVRLGFNNVIDAFHGLRGGPIDVRFYRDERAAKGGIQLTDELFRLKETFQYANLTPEVEARWRLVETAWATNLPATVLEVQYDPRTSHRRCGLEIPDIHPSVPCNALEVSLADPGITILGFRMPAFTRRDHVHKRETWEWVLRESDDLGSGPAMIVGDFNTAPGDPASRCGDCLEDLVRRGWRHARPSSGLSWRSRTGTERQIDHLFLSSFLSARSVAYAWS